MECSKLYFRILAKDTDIIYSNSLSLNRHQKGPRFDPHSLDYIPTTYA